jgi:hypothetical protein
MGAPAHSQEAFREEAERQERIELGLDEARQFTACAGRRLRWPPSAR